jgi:hypothetical protein
LSACSRFIGVGRSLAPDRLQLTPYTAAASCADAPSCACGAYAWRFLPSVFFSVIPFRFSNLRMAIQPSNPPHCNSVSLLSTAIMKIVGRVCQRGRFTQQLWQGLARQELDLAGDYNGGETIGKVDKNVMRRERHTV